MDLGLVLLSRHCFTSYSDTQCGIFKARAVIFQENYQHISNLDAHVDFTLVVIDRVDAETP